MYLIVLIVTIVSGCIADSHAIITHAYLSFSVDQQASNRFTEHATEYVVHVYRHCCSRWIC